MEAINQDINQMDKVIEKYDQNSMMRIMRSENSVRVKRKSVRPDDTIALSELFESGTGSSQGKTRYVNINENKGYIPNQKIGPSSCKFKCLIF